MRLPCRTLVSGSTARGIGVALRVDMKAGLQRLADSYGIDRNGAAEFKRRAHQFIEGLAENLSRMIGRRVRLLGGVGLSSERFADFFAAPAQHAFSISWPGAMRAAVRIDDGLIAALIAGALGGGHAASSDGPATTAGGASLTGAEARFANRLLKGALAASAPLGFDESQPGCAGAPKIVEGALERPDKCDPAAKALVAIGRVSLDGCNAAVALGLVLDDAVTAPLFDSSPPLARPGDWTAAMRARLGAAQLPLAAVLGSIELPFTAVGKLKPGSILTLGSLGARAPRVELRYGGLRLCAGTVIEECGWHRFLVQNGGLT